MRLGANHPMGPLQLADFIGLDTCLAVMQVLYEGLADTKYRPCPLLVKYVEAGWLGRKSGRGLLRLFRRPSGSGPAESISGRQRRPRRLQSDRCDDGRDAEAAMTDYWLNKLMFDLQGPGGKERWRDDREAVLDAYPFRRRCAKP